MRRGCNDWNHLKLRNEIWCACHDWNQLKLKEGLDVVLIIELPKTKGNMGCSHDDQIHLKKMGHSRNDRNHLRPKWKKRTRRDCNDQNHLKLKGRIWRKGEA